LREGDMLCRLGSDDFALILEQVSGESHIIAVVNKIIAAVSEPVILGDGQAQVSARLGIAVFPVDGNEPQALIRHAETALQRAKVTGKNNHVFFTPDMLEHEEQWGNLGAELTRALDENELCLHLQPQVNLSDGRLRGLEALLRWQHPERGFVSPGDFISLAEDTGLIVPIGMWVLKQACQQLAKWQWQSHTTRNLFMSVNLSSKQLAQSALVNQIRDVLQETHVEPKHLKLEITESAVMENAETAVQLLRRLKALGVQLSIDDFGTGYSSLGYLHRFPVDILKIDRSFVGRIAEAAENIEIVRTIVSLADNMGMEVVAEGVETLAQFSQLRALNCQFGQGYLFSRPVEASAIDGWISRTPDWQVALFPKGEFVAPAKTPVVQLRSA
ncbi:MAG TPA: phosphodiesterase, partial [Burkholderiaceae bacterium]|nr:phosphodiesterase [Burkholderiaceae bacterium]